MEKMYLIAEAGRPKELLEAWRAEFLAGTKAFHKFGEEIGARQVFGARFERPCGFGFPRGEVPEGWLKPKSNGFTCPKVSNTAMLDRIAAIPFPDHPDQMITRELGLPTSVSYKRKSGSGVRGLLAGGINTFGFCWTVRADGGLADVILIAPDYAAVAKEYDEVSWRPEGASPSIPEGFRKVSEAEVDLIFAQLAVEREKYQEISKEMALMLDVHTPSDLFASIQSCVVMADIELVAKFDAGPTGMAISVELTDETLKVHPPLEAAVMRIAPYLVACVEDDWSEQTQSSGRILFQEGCLPFLNMHDDDNLFYEGDVDTTKLLDMEFAPEDASEAPASVPE